MLFKRRFLQPIRDGEVTLTFRRWKRPQAKVGSKHRLWDLGLLEIEEVATVRQDKITEQEALAAGYSLAELSKELDARSGDIYRVKFRYLDDFPDARAELASQVMGSEDLEHLTARLKMMDARSSNGPWTVILLGTIQKNPGVSSALLAERLDWERQQLKTAVRKLKNLGLTESLQVGYRLTTRGESFLFSLP